MTDRSHFVLPTPSLLVSRLPYVSTLLRLFHSIMNRAFTTPFKSLFVTALCLSFSSLSAAAAGEWQ
jgi:hypothetical protein